MAAGSCDGDRNGAALDGARAGDATVAPRRAFGSSPVVRLETRAVPASEVAGVDGRSSTETTGSAADGAVVGAFGRTRSVNEVASGGAGDDRATSAAGSDEADESQVPATPPTTMASPRAPSAW